MTGREHNVRDQIGGKPVMKALHSFDDLMSEKTEEPVKKTQTVTQQESSGEIVEKRPSQKARRRAKPQKRDLTMTVIKFGMAVVGAGAAILSMYYTSVWLMEFLYFLLAWLLSFIMVLFGVLSFEVILLMSFSPSSTWRHHVVSGVFIALWLIVTSFSIMSTVAGQYNTHAESRRSVVSNGESDLIAATELRNIKDQLSKLEERESDKRKQYTLAISLLEESGKSVEDRETHNGVYIDAQRRVQYEEQGLRQIEYARQNLVEKEALLYKEHPQLLVDGGDVPDFYAWIAGIFKADRDLVQFWLSLFPAIFVDVIAPVALAVAMFFGRKKIEE